MRPSPGRLAAARALVQLEQRGGHADEVYGQHARGVEGAERRLGWALVLGVERHRFRIDHSLNRHLSRRPQELDPPVRAALRCAVFQIWELDRVPERAAVHQAVEVTRALGAPRAAGLVNAALRSLQRSPERAGEPRDEATIHSLLPWILKRMPMGAAAAFNREPSLAIRPRRPGLAEQLARDGVELAVPEPPLDNTGALLVAGRDPTGLSGWAEGWFAIQDAAAQAVVRLLDPQPGERVLDACAAPGGKTFAIADAVGEGGHVVALDVSAERLELLRSEAARLGLERVAVLAGDALRCLGTAEHEGKYDRVLLDAPCSALGTLRRHPELRWQRRPADLPRFAALQQSLLRAAAAAVKPGGTLVYAVCSFADEEGAEVVDRFVEQHLAFERVPIGAAWGGARTPVGDLLTWPTQGPWDSFYAAVLRRSS
ncbi:MAG: 16S rRNA (cytosine(967)-C(5))-methyltransferase RsmB [Myxococcota bacterium]|nr:16S rRNA (cytosine(967)-C(5))-methyltransferase RsmB [Myxococcota bacterium]